MIISRPFQRASRPGIQGACVAIVMLTGCQHESPTSNEGPHWIELFDGENLTGWTQVNGDAPYDVVEGAIRGTNVLETPNSFLATEQSFSDFVLEFESRSVGEANSGVQFRTDLAPGTWSGVVGYQLDIDPTARKWTGGIYLEGVHLWRQSMARNPACQAAYEHGVWNTYRIEAVGPVIATWVNNIPCAHMVGDHHTNGFIALQVHAIGQEKSYLGSFTEWRNLRLLNEPEPQDLWLAKRAALIEGWLDHRISDIERENGWQLIDVSQETSVFEIGSDSIEIVMDVKLDASADGVLDYAFNLSGQPCVGQYKIFNDVTLEASGSTAGLMGSFPDTHAASNLSEPGRPKRVYADERWNRVRLIVTDDRIQHWLNGVKVVDYAACAQSPGSSKTDQLTLKLTTNDGVIETKNAKMRAIP